MGGPRGSVVIFLARRDRGRRYDFSCSQRLVSGIISGLRTPFSYENNVKQQAHKHKATDLTNIKKGVDLNINRTLIVLSGL
jgi:hypothetical protein